MVDFEVVPRRTALINVDMQNWFVDKTYNGLEVLERINRIAEMCREAGILVIHTSAVLRPDGSNMGIMGEVTPVVKKGVLNKGAETAALHRNLLIAPSDILLDKPRFGAFYGSDLEVILRSRGIDTVIITGIATQACCDTTAREAHARDFRVLFLSDGTATASSEPEKAEKAHQAALDVLHGLFAQVLTIDELLQKINRAAEIAGAGVTS